MNLIIEIFIGEIKEDQLLAEYCEQTSVESLREIKRKYIKDINDKIENGDWREPNFAGEFAVHLGISSKTLDKEMTKQLERLVNAIY